MSRYNQAIQSDLVALSQFSIGACGTSLAGKLCKGYVGKIAPRRTGRKK